MTLLSIKTATAIAWALAVCIAGLLANPNSLWAWAALVLVAVVPPLVMVRMWNDPPQTMSESIREARR